MCNKGKEYSAIYDHHPLEDVNKYSHRDCFLTRDTSKQNRSNETFKDEERCIYACTILPVFIILEKRQMNAEKHEN